MDGAAVRPLLACRQRSARFYRFPFESPSCNRGDTYSSGQTYYLYVYNICIYLIVLYIYIYIQYTFDIQLNYALSITYISCINVLFFTRYPPPSKEAARVADELEAYLVALGASLGLGPARGPAEARR